MIKVGNTRRNPLARAIRNAFDPRELFRSTTQGAIYDYDSFDYLYQKSDGSTPITALEQPVGLMLDKRYGGARGAEKLTNPNFDTDSDWTKEDLSVTISGGKLVLTATPTTKGVTQTRSGAFAGEVIEFSITIDSISGGISVLYGAVSRTYTSPGTYNFIGVTTAASTIAIRASGTTTAVIDRVSAKQVLGLHAYQSTDAARPVLSARYNLATASEGAASTYTVSNVTDASTSITGYEASLQFGDNSLNRSAVKFMTLTSGISYTASFVVQMDDGNAPVVGTTSSLGDFSIRNGSAAISSDPATVTHLGGGIYRVSVASVSTGSGAIGVYKYTTQSARTFRMTAADVRLTADANARLPAYQRVTTATDYDSAGFKRFDLSDRTDDHFAVASGGGSTTGFLLCAAIQPTGAGTARTIFSDRGTNTGYKVEIDASNNLLFTAGNGTAFTTCTGPTLTAGTPYVITCWHDGTNLNVRVNRGATAQQAFATASAGTTGFTIGKDNAAASGYFSGRRFALTYIKDWTVSLSALESLIVWTASKGGISV